MDPNLAASAFGTPIPPTSPTRLKLTKTVIEKLEPPQKGYTIYRDSVLVGFGVRVTAAGAKSYVFERRINGKERRFTIGRFPEKVLEKARKEATALAGEIAGGKDPKAEEAKVAAVSTTLRGAMEDLIATRDLKERTKEDMKTNLERSVKGWLDKPLQDLTPEMVLRKHRELAERSAAQANLTMRYVRGIWNFARARQMVGGGDVSLGSNPVSILRDLKAWKKVGRRQTVLTKSDLKPWFEAISTLRSSSLRDFMITVLLTGLRRSEAQGLCWENVSLFNGSITVKDPKNRRDHTLPLGKYLLGLLKKRQETAPRGAVYVFEDRLGRVVSNFRYVQDKVAEAGVSFTVHDLRRTFATVAESLDLSSYAVKKLLNHATAGDVTAGYIVMDLERLRSAMQRIEDAILRHGGVVGAGEVVELTKRKSSAGRR